MGDFEKLICHGVTIQHLNGTVTTLGDVLLIDLDTEIIDALNKYQEKKKAAKP